MAVAVCPPNFKDGVSEKLALYFFIAVEFGIFLDFNGFQSKKNFFYCTQSERWNLKPIQNRRTAST